MAYEIGQRVGDYEIFQLLGVGGMGSVYRVRNVISDRTEAMKVLLPDLTAERDLAIRFISEIRTLASFDHPNIALLHTAFQAENQLIMMMEFVEGQTLEQRAKQGPMAITDVCGYVYQALSALSYAHGRGVVHRDIKPANLMLTSHGIVKLMDFGIAKSKVETNLTRPGTTIGSLYYMSPEQVRGDAVDARSDLYSMGIVLYELLAGRRPFEAETTFSILNQQLNTAPPPPIEVNTALPRGLNDLILHVLAKDAAGRFQSADAFREALRPFCQSQAAEAGYGAVAAKGVFAETVAWVPSAFSEVSAAVPTAPPPTAPPPPVGVKPVAPAPYPAAQPVAKKGNKALWIGTGIAAALLAMVGLAVGLPHLLGTHAAESGDRASVAQPVNQPQPVSQPVPDGQPVNQGAPGDQPVNTGSGAGVPVAAGSGAAVSPAVGTAGGGRSVALGAGPTVSGPKRAPYVPAGPANLGSGGQGAGPAAASAGELEQQQDRLTEMNGRAASVNGTLARMRRDQEAQGVGLRGDIDSADNRMDSYLRSAEQDLRTGNAASAAKNLNRAESELATIEKFLGR